MTSPSPPPPRTENTGEQNPTQKDSLQLQPDTSTSVANTSVISADGANTSLSLNYASLPPHDGTGTSINSPPADVSQGSYNNGTGTSLNSIMSSNTGTFNSAHNSETTVRARIFGTHDSAKATLTGRFAMTRVLSGRPVFSSAIMEENYIRDSMDDMYEQQQSSIRSYCSPSFLFLGMLLASSLSLAISVFFAATFTTGFLWRNKIPYETFSRLTLKGGRFSDLYFVGSAVGYLAIVVATQVPLMNEMLATPSFGSLSLSLLPSSELDLNALLVPAYSELATACLSTNATTLTTLTLEQTRACTIGFAQVASTAMLFYWPLFNTLIAYLFRGMLTMLFRLPAAQVTFLNLAIYVPFIVVIVKSGAPLVLFGWPVVIVFCLASIRESVMQVSAEASKARRVRTHTPLHVHYHIVHTRLARTCVRRSFTLFHPLHIHSLDVDGSVTPPHRSESRWRSAALSPWRLFKPKSWRSPQK